MPTTYQPLPLSDADLAALQAALPALGVVRSTIGTDQAIRLFRNVLSGDVAVIRRGAAVTGDDPAAVGVARYLVHHPAGGAGLWVFNLLQDVINFIAIGSRNQAYRLHSHGGSQPGAIVGDADPVSPLVFT
jgi:hypothetical protein